MGARTRAFDWSKTALGPVDAWPQSLRSTVGMLLPSKAQIILFWGPEFVVLYNDAYRPVFGAKHPHALGLPGREAWSEIWDGMLHPLLAGVVRTGEAFWARDLLFAIERYGFLEETYFDVSYDPVRVESGGVGGVYCIVTETTERVIGTRRMTLLKDLAARNATARSAREACTLAMETLAAQPQDVQFALAHLDGELLGCTPGAQEQRTSAKPELVKVLPLAGSGARSGELVVGLNPRRPLDEAYRAFLALVADQFVTALANARAYEAERMRAEALAEIDRAKTAFFSNVSHEFRTPLTLMLGPLEELLASETGERHALLSVAHRNGQRLLKLVNTLLDFSRIEAGRTQAAYELTDVSVLTTDLASNFRSACEKAGLALVVDCERGALAWIDREMWEKIVLNLLSNAFKFTLKGSIEVRLRAQDEHLRLTVRDTGTGIPAYSLERIFERFHRVEGARGRSHEGSGIGLALVQELVRLHDGSIRVESDPGVGTTFTVDIPKGSLHRPGDRAGDSRKPQSDTGSVQRADSFRLEALGWLGEPTTAVEHRAGAARVLVVDDNADLRDYARRLLAEDYDVELAADGREALAAARARKPDIVLTDVMMPQLDGFGLIRELRKDPVLSVVPIILLSARAGEEARLEGIHQGADDYLVKPFSARELLVRVGSLLQSQELRRRALEAQRESEQSFRLLFESMDEGYCIIEVFFDAHDRPLDFRFLEVNPAFEKQSGLKGARGKLVSELVSGLEQYWFDIYGRIARTGETLRFDNEAAPLGRWYDVCAFRIGPPELRRVGVVFNDITGRKRAEQALRDADRRKDEFLATLAHELRNPLAPLRNALQLLRAAEPGDATQAKAGEIMERQLNHLVRLVDDLLEMARISRGTLELRSERVELNAVVRSALETSEPLIAASRHRVEISIPGEAIWLEGDPVRLAQIVSNMLNNAAKYTPDGGLIALEARREGAQATIAVRDNGAGIPPESLSRIFEMFNRGTWHGEQRQGGLGIGLALSRRLAEMHGGTIEARSEGVGKGSEFIVSLPLASVQAPAIIPAAKTPQILPSGRVLIVDDNRDAAASLAMLLHTLGAEVYVAHDGPAAIETFCARAPEIVLLDVGMPGMSGYEVARRLREHDPDRRTTLVALTGWGQDEDRRRAREAGFDHHLVKPADVELLQRLIAQSGRRGVGAASEDSTPSDRPPGSPSSAPSGRAPAAAG